MLVGHSEALAVTLLKNDPLAEVGVKALDVRRMDGQPALIRLARGRQDSERQQRQEAQRFLMDVRVSDAAAPAALAFLSLRFSLMDLPDFLDADCRGDLSAMSAS